MAPILFIVAAILPFLSPLANESQLNGWSNYGQWFGALAALFSTLAFIVAARTLQIQQQQIREANETSARTMAEMIEQTRTLKEAAETNALAALIHYCERYAHINTTGETKEQLFQLAGKAKERLMGKLDLH